MRLVSLLAIASVSFTSAGIISNDVLTDLYARAEQFQKLIDTTIAEKSKFTKDDLAKVWPNLMNADFVRDLIVNDKVSFSLKGLSVPEPEADKAILGAIAGTKTWLGTWLKSYVAKKTELANIDETKAQFRAILDDLSKNDKLKETAAEKIDWVFKKHPGFASLIRYTVAAMPDMFDKDVLDYVKVFLAEARASHPEMVAKLWSLAEWAQTKYALLPEAQFNNLREVFASFK